MPLHQHHELFRRTTMLLAVAIFIIAVFSLGRLPLRKDESRAHTGSATGSDLVAKAEIALSMNHPAEAERYFRDALAQNPEQHLARKNLVYLLTLECRTYEALAQRYELLRRDQCILEDLLLLAKPADVVQVPELEKFLRHNPDDAHLLLAKARIARTGHRYEEANRWVERALVAAPKLVEAHVEQGLLLLEREPTEQALTHWHRELSVDADEHPDVWLVRGVLARMLHDSRGATRCFAEASLRDPNHRPAAHQLSLALAAIGEEPLAAKLSNRVKLLDELARTIDQLYSSPNSCELLSKAAALMESLGRIWEAAAWYRVIDSVEPGNASARTKAAELHASLFPKAPVVMSAANPVLQLDLPLYPLPAFDHSSATVEHFDSDERHSLRFADVAPSNGLDFSFIGVDRPVRRSRRICEFYGAGIAILDFDLDGWPEIYCAQGALLNGDELQGKDRDRLFRNTGDGHFEDVTAATQLGDIRFSQGAAVGDFNNDGFPDFFLANLGENRLYQNNGDGTFSDVSMVAAIEGAHWTTSCALADLSGDGLPDIYEVNYLGGARVLEVLCGGSEGEDCRPRSFASEPDRFFLNLGNGQFSELTQQAGINGADGKGLGIVVADFDGDGRPSVVVANDTTANHFYVNRSGRGEMPAFEERAVFAGLAYDGNGLSQACMGIAVGDTDADGQLDLLITNFFDESNTLYRGNPGQYFDDVTRAAALHEPSLARLGFGTQFLDADLDGDPDLVVANGHINDLGQDGADFQMRPQLFENQGGQFVELHASQAGPYFDRKLLGRALARLDFDRDGREDFLVTHLDAPVSLLHNETPDAGHFLSIRLAGVRCDRDAIGATVTVHTEGGVRRVRQVTAGDGYMCSNERRLVFGLGGDTSAREVIVHWPSGSIQEFGAVAADREWIVVEGCETLFTVSH